MTRCLLVIDIQNDYFPGGQLPLWQAEETEARIVRAIHLARSHGDRVVLVQHVSTKSSGLLAKDSVGCAIRPAIRAAAENAPVVIKHLADAFQDTNLMDHLADTSDLEVCGMMTQNCVVFTALSRSADRFRVRVIGDLCTAPTETVHRIALNALGSKLDVMDCTDMWRSEPAN